MEKKSAELVVTSNIRIMPKANSIDSGMTDAAARVLVVLVQGGVEFADVEQVWQFQHLQQIVVLSFCG